jgi:hypothetical protein
LKPLHAQDLDLAKEFRSIATPQNANEYTANQFGRRISECVVPTGVRFLSSAQQRCDSQYRRDLISRHQDLQTFTQSLRSVWLSEKDRELPTIKRLIEGLVSIRQYEILGDYTGTLAVKGDWCVGSFGWFDGRDRHHRLYPDRFAFHDVYGGRTYRDDSPGAEAQDCDSVCHLARRRRVLPASRSRW